jgi:metal-responsive CopG/Arc/MetJ family transcriptional regulator
MEKRTTINFSPKLAQTVEQLSIEEYTTKAEIVRKAISLYSFLYNEVKKNNGKLIITNSTGEEAKEIVF